MPRPSFIVLIPAYRAARQVADVIADVIASVPEAAGHVLVIDDGSDDETSRIAEAAGASVLRHGRNRGKGAALMTGLTEARRRGYRAALTVDADGQHPGDACAKVLHAPTGALVLGVRDLAGAGAPKKNRFSNGISNFFLSRFAGIPLADTQCGLRRYPVDETLALMPQETGYAFEAEIVLLAAAAGLAIEQVDIRVIYPPENERVTHFDAVKDPARIILAVLRTVRRTRAAGPRSVAARRTSAADP